MQKNEKNILALTGAAHFLTHFFVLVFPVLVMPISRDFGAEISAIYKLSLPMYFCYGMLAIPWGYLSDRYSEKGIMGTGILVAGLGFLSAGTAQSPVALTVSLAFVGVGCSAYHPSGLALLSKGIRVRGRALGINGLCGNLGIAAAPLFAGVFSFLLGWKTALLIFGLAGILLGIVCLLVPLSIGREDLQQSSGVDRRQATTIFLLMCAAMLFSGLMYRGYTLFLPTFFESRLSGLTDWVANLAGARQLSPDTGTLVATLVVTAVYLTGMVGQLLGGRVADRYELRWAYLAFFSCALPFLVTMRFVGGVPLIVCAGIFVLFSLGMQPIENSLLAVLTPPQWRSVVYGVKFTIVFGGGSLAVWAVSYVQSGFGLEAVTSLLVLFLLFSVLIVSVLILVSRGTSLRHEHKRNKPAI